MLAAALTLLSAHFVRNLNNLIWGVKKRKIKRRNNMIQWWVYLWMIAYWRQITNYITVSCDWLGHVYSVMNIGGKEVIMRVEHKGRGGKPRQSSYQGKKSLHCNFRESCHQFSSMIKLYKCNIKLICNIWFTDLVW